METRWSVRASPAKASRISAKSCEVSGIPGIMLPQASILPGRRFSQLPRLPQALFHRGSLLGDQPVAVLQTVAGDGNRIAEYHRDGPGPEQREPFRQDVPCACDAVRDAIEAARQRRHRRALLERQ